MYGKEHLPMKVCGVIAEYNPFHSGHAYQLRMARQLSGCDYVIAVMSGDFVQRGAPAIIEKYTRAQAALAGGADLVLMLPVSGSTASAEGFARAGISALRTTGVITAISFGCEDVQICGENYRRLAACLSRENEDFRRQLLAGLAGGMSYPKARVEAIRACYSEDFDLTLLDTPNNLLAFEYLRALADFGEVWDICPVKRLGSYHDTDGACSEAGFSSASAVRQILLAEHETGLERLVGEGQLPETAGDIFRQYMERSPLLQENDFSDMLHYALLAGQNDGFSDYLDCGDDLSARIVNALLEFDSFSGFLTRLKNKSVSRARISRALTHILLNLRSSDTLISPAGMLPYLRVLGFRASAAPLLHELKHRAQAPVITRVPEAFDALGEPGLTCFRQDILASEIYRSQAKAYPDDYRRKVEIL
jgi:predicted nucleotidyltransferase